jgi:N utilization substance protein A
MGEEDGIIVKKDGDMIDLEDTNEDVEYKISLGEEEEEVDDIDLEIEESDDDLMDIDGMSEERAGKLIMTARAPWFA